MKIHLGCGGKILQGYVNCDVAPFAGGKPDKLFDLLDSWPFQDGSADEVLAVHVWEHFYEWDHPHITREAWRALKPGGKFILEMPDLIKACRNFVKNPSMEGRAAMMGYWGIYSDPSYECEYQAHKSGWWPKKLTDWLVERGFSVVIMPPQHKGKKVERDMRCEATKV